MAQVERNSQFSNLLYIHGQDLFPSGGLSRTVVRQTLFSNANGIGNFFGEVDFILFYTIGYDNFDHGGLDLSPLSNSPPGRPFRGISRIPEWHLTAVQNTADLGGHLAGSIGHEIGHHWLVPGELSVQDGNQALEMPSVSTIAAALNRGEGMPRLPLLGRQGSHWSAYLHADGSVMDGINHDFDFQWEAEYGFSKSQGYSGLGVNFEFDGQQLQTFGRFSGFELFLMGMPPRSAVPFRHIVQALQPIWVYPLAFQAGLYVELDNGGTWYAGFDGGPHQVSARSTLDQLGEGVTSLELPLDPLHRVVFRVVQLGNECELQSRVFPPQVISLENGGRIWSGRVLGHQIQSGGDRLVTHRTDARVSSFSRMLSAARNVFRRRPAYPPNLTCNEISGNSTFAPPGNRDIYSNWRRLAHFQSRVRRIGVAMRHYDNIFCFARMRPKQLCLTVGSQSSTPSLTVENPIPFSSTQFGSTVHQDGSMVLPYRVSPNGGSVRFLHNAQLDDAPRQVANAPSGDFVFGGEIELTECLATQVIGRAGSNRTYIGFRDPIRFTDFDITSRGPDYELRRAEPENGSYRYLFCLASEDEIDQQTLQPILAQLNEIRRAWEPAFAAMTNGRRGADTTIPFP